MAFRGFVEEATPFLLRGWVASDTFPALIPFVDIVINRRLAASVRASIFREDLLQHGYGDGRRGFSFTPFESLSTGSNVLELFVSGTDQLLENGTHRLQGGLPAYQPKVRAQINAGDTNAARSFLERASNHISLTAGMNVAARGAGLEQVLSEKKIAAKQLRSGPVDLVLVSGAAEFFYPSIAETLDGSYAALTPGGLLLFDFACEDPELTAASGRFDPSGSEEFIRIYSETELRSFLLEAGFETVEIAAGPETMKRGLAVARKPVTT